MSEQGEAVTTPPLEARRKLLEAGTPGPWKASPVAALAGQTIRTEEENRPIARLMPDDRDRLDMLGDVGYDRAVAAIDLTKSDAALIVQAVNDYPALLAIAAALEQVLLHRGELPLPLRRVAGDALAALPPLPEEQRS